MISIASLEFPPGYRATHPSKRLSNIRKLNINKYLLFEDLSEAKRVPQNRKLVGVWRF